MIVPILPVAVGIVLAAAFARIVIGLLANIARAGQPDAAELAGQIVALYGFALLSVFVTLIAGGFALYYMLERRNRHFKRQQQLFRVLAAYLSQRTQGGPSVAKFAHVVEDSVFEESDRPAAIWAILYVFVTPIVGLIIAYTLAQDLRRHEEAQSTILIQLSAALGEVGITQPGFPRAKSHKRDPLLYLILTLITGGLVWIYWFYLLLKDYNEHFLDQAKIEDQLLVTLKPPATARLCQSCGNPVPEGAKFCPVCGKAREP